MSKQTTTSLLWVLVPVLSMNLAACKKSTNEPDPATSAKSLNKSTIAPKKWYSQGSAFIHDLKAGGVYSATGTWKWKNNSDTLEIVTQAGYPETYWKVYWNTENEMNCEKIGTFTPLLYKDKVW